VNPTLAWLPQGTVYGSLLNFRREYALWAPKMAEPQYKAAPKAPVLYVKTANTFAAHGAAIAVPGEVEVGAALGLVKADPQCYQHLAQTGQAQAAIENRATGLQAIAGVVLLADLSLPHASYYRPPIKFRNRDGFLGCGPACVPLSAAGDLGALKITVRINGELRQTVDLSTLVRDAATLLADVEAFMTLQPGDVLMLGTDCLDDGTRPRAKAGDRIEISAPGFAPLVQTLVEEPA
jgi:5-oxopent-3-ene-1,2,5-tricarboxylate decarboxylase/2-hydroxyhepta-2,4-diene-1,7-dioate isomerase